MTLVISKWGNSIVENSVQIFAYSMADYFDLFGDSLLSQFGSIPVDELRGKVIGIYFAYARCF